MANSGPKAERWENGKQRLFRFLSVINFLHRPNWSQTYIGPALNYYRFTVYVLRMEIECRPNWVIHNQSSLHNKPLHLLHNEDGSGRIILMLLRKHI